MEYMSQEGYDKLVEELRQLIEVEEPRVKESLVEARAQGDLSENFEYHAAKREHGRLLGRIRFKQKLLANTRVIDKAALDNDRVHLLSKVSLTNIDSNSKMTYIIVSPHEADLHEGKISVNSPIAKSLLNKTVGDLIEINVPAGLLRLRIEKIE